MSVLVWSLRKCLCAAVALACVHHAGCAAPATKNSRIEATRRWDRVRSEVKLQLARQQCEVGQFEDCAKTAQEAIALDPTVSAGYALLAQANLELGKPASAQQIVDTAKHLGLNSARLTYLEGVVLEQQGRLPEALNRFTQASEQEKKNVDFLIARAECLVAMNRAEEAQAFLEGCAGLTDDPATVHELLGRVALLLGQDEQAARHFGDALVFAMDRPAVTQQLGIVLARLDRCAQALTLLVPLIQGYKAAHQQVEPLSGQAWRAAGQCCLATGQTLQARDLLLPYARANRDDAKAQLLLAKAALAVGDSWTALEAIEHAERANPAHREVRFVRAALNWKMGRLVDAGAALEKLVEQYPDDLDIRCLYAEVLAAQGAHRAARRHFEHALRLAPHHAWANQGFSRLKEHSLMDAP